MTENYEKRRANRRKATSEVFTPHWMVNQILDTYPKSTWEPGKTFIDPAAGNGNILINVLYRKIAVYNHDPLEALQSIYGVDIMRDNVRECRLRLLKLVGIFYEIDEELVTAVFNNIVWINRKKYPKGSLEYDFSFKNKAKPSDIARWMQWIKDGILNEVTLPVTAEEIAGGMIDIFEKPTDYADELCD